MEKHLTLLAWFSPELAQNTLIPEIEENCRRFGVLYPKAYEMFQHSKFAKNSLYFHHSYADYDIPIGEEYEAAAMIDENWKIPVNSIYRSPSKVLCFFTAYKIQPADNAACGHHEFSLIQFPQGIPQLIYDKLFEITELKPLYPQRRVILCSETELQRCAQKPGRYYL